MATNDQVQGNSESTIDDRIAKATEVKTEVKETQEAVPTSEKEEVVSTTKPETEVAKPSGSNEPQGDTPNEDLDLPDGVTQRTKEQFDKLKKRLSDAESKLKTTPPPSSDNSVFDSFRAPQDVPMGQPMEALPFLNQQQVGAIQQQFIDEEGNVDIAGVNRALLEANEVARQALIRAKQSEDKFTRFEENQQVKEAHTTHPDLDPQNPSFDPSLFDMVKDRLLRNMYEGRNQSLLEVTNEIKKVYKGSTNVAKVQEDAVEAYKQGQQNRDQGPIENGRGAPREDVGNLEDLRRQTRQGKAEALDERLKNLGVL